MYRIRNDLLALMLATASIFSMAMISQASAATSEDLDKDSLQALHALYKS
ncbi:MAG: twin-arginine translocation pathway signal protein, partial [Zetaproteobacteria bacterium CG02_land_8_20_14_3_00_50_9]